MRIWSLRVGQGSRTPVTANHNLDHAPLVRILRARYHERHFVCNQQIGGSMSLTPLCPGLKIDLHVRTPSDLHRSFPRLHPAQVKFASSRVARA